MRTVTIIIAALNRKSLLNITSSGAKTAKAGLLNSNSVSAVPVIYAKEETGE